MELIDLSIISMLTSKEVLATISSLIYVWLAAKENNWCWIFGIIASVLSFFVFFDVNLYSDASLQIFYLVMSAYGWYSWNNLKKNSKVLIDETILDDLGIFESNTSSIYTWSISQHFTAISIGVVLGLLLGYFWSFFGASLPYIDAFTTAFSIIATYMVTQKILENWLYWIVIDFICIFVYIHREIYIFAALFLLYFLIAIFGYSSWKKKL